MDVSAQLARFFQLSPNRILIGLLALGMVAPAALAQAPKDTAPDVDAIESGGTHPLDTLQPGHWYRVPNSRLDVVDPCPQTACPPGNLRAVIGAWSGGTYDTVSNRLLVWGGGHADYAGNEIYAFDVESMTWSRVSEPSSSYGGTPTSFVYPDGKPRSLHTHAYIEFVPTLNSFISFGGVAPYPVGGVGKKVFEYKFDDSSWSRRIPDVPAGGWARGTNAIYDLQENAVWVVTAASGSDRLHRYDVATNSWTSHVRYQHKFYTTAALDPVRRLIVAVGNDRIRVWNVANPEADEVVPSTSGPSVLQGRQAPGFQYDPTIQKFVGWDGGTGVYTLDAGTWTWESVPDAPGNTVTPSSPANNGTYGRFRYMPDYNAYILVNSVEQDVYFYKLNDEELLRSEAPDALQ